MEGVMRQMGLVSQSAESRCQALAYRGDKKRRGPECESIINEGGREGERKNFFCLFLPFNWHYTTVVYNVDTTSGPIQTLKALDAVSCRRS